MMHFNVTAHRTISVVIEVHNIPGPVDHVVMNNIELHNVSLDGIKAAGTYHYNMNTNSVFIHPFNTTIGIALSVYMH